MNMRIIPGALAGLLCVQLAVVPVLATDDAIGFYEGLMASQGQEGSVNLDSAEAEIAPADPNSGGSTVTIVTGTATETTTTTTVPDITTDTTGTTTDTSTSTGTTTVPETETAPTYTIKEVTLSSQYSSEYDLYEYSGGGYFYFYSNAKNGDIRSESVYLDVPSDMSYTVKKDGTAITYTNKATITELGSYYFTLTYANEDTMTQYTASFRFRIEAPVEPTTTDTTTATVSPEEYVLGDDGVVRPTTTETETDETDFDFDMEALDPDALNADEELDFDLDAYLEDLTIEDEDSQQVQSLECIYNDEAGYYQYTLLSGSYFYASVPNGMVTNGQATVYAGSETLEYTAYKDGVLLEEFLPGATLSEAGNYSIFITESTTQYWVAYDQVAEPVLTFTITDGSASNAVSVFAVPQLMTVTEITFNDEPLDITPGKSHYYLSDDGVYSITMDSPINTQVLKLTKDTQPPQFTVDASQNNLATITYASDDVADCILSSGGEVLSSGTWVTSVEDPGDYTLEVIDKAGNATVQSFTVTYGLNGAALVAITLAIVLLVVGFFAYRRISTKVTVR